MRWVVVAATLGGAVVRFYRLDSLPPQAWVDEIWFNLRARDLLRTGEFHVFYRTWSGVHPLLVDLTAAVHGLGHQSLVASRVVAALGGVLTVPLAYAATSELWRDTGWTPARRRLTAVVTAVVLATLFPLVVASRIGYEPALFPPLMLVYVWQSRRAQRGDRWWSWVVAGLTLGGIQYLSPHGRFLIPLAVAMGLHDLWTSAPARRRSIFLGLCLAAGTAVLVALPLIAFFVREPEWLLARARHVTAGLQRDGVGFLLGNALRIAAAFNVVGDLDARHNIPGRPMLDALQSIGFWVGIAWALRNIRRIPAGRELLGGLVLMSVPSLVTDEAPHFERMIGAAVAAAALVAVGWVAMWTRLRRVTAAWAPGPSVALLAVAWVAASAGINVYDYFVRYPRAPGLATAMTTFPVELARDLIARARTEAVFVERITDREDVFAFDFMLPGTAVRRLDFRQCLPLTDGRATRTTYLVFPERDPAAVDRLRRAYPQLNAHRHDPHPATLMDKAVVLEIPPGTPAPSFGHVSHARFAPGLTLVGYDASRTTILAGERVSLTLYWRVEAEPGAADLIARAEVSSIGHSTDVIARSDGRACRGLYPPALWRPGDVVPTDFSLELPPGIPPGDYPVAVGWSRGAPGHRLTVLDADHRLPDDRVRLAPLTVRAP